MNAIADRFRVDEVGSYFLYTHEAHPGENYPHLTTMAQKQKHAGDLQAVYGVDRTILLDALDGACHRAYGSMPNMSWIFNQAGVPIYKSDWTDAYSVESAIEYFIQANTRRQGGQRLAPFRVERLDLRLADREAFFAGLARNGPKAVREFQAAFS